MPSLLLTLENTAFVQSKMDLIEKKNNPDVRLIKSSSTNSTNSQPKQSTAKNVAASHGSRRHWLVTFRNLFDETLFVSESSRLDQDANSGPENGQARYASRAAALST